MKFARSLFGVKQRLRRNALRAEGDAAMRSRDWASAIASYTRYLRHEPNDPAILVQFGHALKETGCIEEALAAYDRAIAVAPNDEDAAIHRRSLHSDSDQGRLLRKALGGADIKLSAQSFEKSEKSPARVQADRARDQKKWRDAALLYCEHLQTETFDDAIWLQLGHVLKELSALNEAAFAYEMAKKLDAGLSDVRIHLADLLMRLGRASDAEPLWAEMFVKQRTFFLQDKSL